MDVPNKVMFAIVIVVSVLQLAIRDVAAVDHFVGGDKGWSTDVNYQAWAKDQIFMVGDRLVFKYEQGAHNVVAVRRDAFKNCVVPPKAHVLSSGYDIVELTTYGRKWYISGLGDECYDGQKLAITVYLREFLPRIPLQPGYQLPPSDAPAPSSTFKIPPGWWNWFLPPTAAPAPAPSSTFVIPPDWWKFIFPPTAAPAPAPSSTFVIPPDWWKFIFPPSAAPAPMEEAISSNE